MTASYLRIGRFQILAFLLALSLTTPSLVPGAEIAVPFLFGEDDKLDQTDLDKAIPSSRALQDDRYLNAPLTRLEYMLSRLEMTLNTDLQKDAIREQLSAGFEDFLAKPIRSVSIIGFARYSRDTGRITAGYRIEHLGQPKKPMRTTCEALLVNLALSAPQTNLGYLLHHAVIGVLAQDDFDTYTPVMTTLAKSIVHRIILQSETEYLDISHGLVCQRTGQKAPIQYQRYSFELH